MSLFRKPGPADFGWIHELAGRQNLRNADFSFCNIYCWDHNINSYVGRAGDRLLVKICLNGEPMYLYPVGSGGLLPAVEAMREDARRCGHEFVMRGITEDVLPQIESLYPQPPRLRLDTDYSDYVYMAADLAELAGKRYHGKKNHVNRFSADHEWHFEPITRDNIGLVHDMAARWFVDMEQEREEDYAGEAEAIRNALRIYFDVGFDGGLIIADGEPAAFTIGEMISGDTLDTHFEKASPHVNGGYTVINQEFAKYMLGKYPGLVYINREEDMGIENLRLAKQSYHPAFLVDKYEAVWDI